MSLVRAREQTQHGIASHGVFHQTSVQQGAVQNASAVRVKAFNMNERTYSQPLFLEAIAGALPALIPMLAPAVGSLISGAAPAVGQVAGQLIRQFMPQPALQSPGSPSQQPRRSSAVRQAQPRNTNVNTNINANSNTSSDPGASQIIAQIGQLAEQVLSALGPASQQVLTPDNARQVMQLIQAGQAATTGVTARQSTAAQSYAQAQYSQAQVAPALLAALPALMPILRQVLSPQTVQSIIQAPERMTGQIINGISDFARIGLQADQQLNEHLRNFLPEEPTALYGLLSGMSLSLSGQYTRQYRRVSRVRLSVEGLPTQVVFGREQVLLQRGVPWEFRLQVETPKTIASAQLQIQIKTANTLKIVHEERLSVGTVSSGPLEIMPRVPASISEALEAGRDYIVTFTLLWRNKRKQLRGTPIQQGITLIDTYLFDRVQEAGELIAMSDRNTWADYWHQVWEMTFDGDTRRADVQSRYYLTLSEIEHTHARLDSRVRKQSDGARETVRLRSGFEFSLFELNHLLRRLDSQAQPLNAAQLSALATPDFLTRFQQGAQHRGQFRGRPGDQATLWVYPSFKLQNIILVKATNVNEQGAVTQLSEEQVRFPMPAMMHFVGVSQS
jgi:hypothetical protein